MARNLQPAFDGWRAAPNSSVAPQRMPVSQGLSFSSNAVGQDRTGISSHVVLADTNGQSSTAEPRPSSLASTLILAASHHLHTPHGQVHETSHPSQQTSKGLHQPRHKPTCCTDSLQHMHPISARLLMSAWTFWSPILDSQGPQQPSQARDSPPTQHLDRRCSAHPQRPSCARTPSATHLCRRSQPVCSFCLSLKQTLYPVKYSHRHPPTVTQDSTAPPLRRTLTALTRARAEMPVI